MFTASRSSTSTTRSRRFTPRRRLALTAAATLALPLGVLGAAVPAHAESLASGWSVTAFPTDENGVALPTTLSSTGKGTAWDVISTDARFSTFKAVVTNAGLQSLFQATSARTFLAPTDAAFEVAGRDVAAKLTDPAHVAEAAALVRGLIGTTAPSLTDIVRSLPGAVLPTSVTTNDCVPLYWYDSYGTAYVSGTSCTAVTTVTPLAPAVDTLTTLDGRTVDVAASAVDGTVTDGARVNIGDAFVSDMIAVSNGNVDAVDTVALSHYGS